jgi:ankyrin repeat protein
MQSIHIANLSPKGSAAIQQSSKSNSEFEELCSLARHNKINEVEAVLSQSDSQCCVHTTDKQGNTLLHIASQNNNKRLVKMCLRFGANINQQNHQGQTALHFAYQYGYIQVGEYLISKGANDQILNRDGLTCYEGTSRSELEYL